MHLEGGGLEVEAAIDESSLSYSAPDEDGQNAVSGAGAGAARQAPQAPAAPPQRGAFGQQIDGEAGGQPQNRAQRRSKKK